MKITVRSFKSCIVLILIAINTIPVLAIKFQEEITQMYNTEKIYIDEKDKVTKISSNEEKKDEQSKTNLKMPLGLKEILEKTTKKSDLQTNKNKIGNIQISNTKKIHPDSDKTKKTLAANQLRKVSKIDIDKLPTLEGSPIMIGSEGKEKIIKNEKVNNAKMKEKENSVPSDSSSKGNKFGTLESITDKKPEIKDDKSDIKEAKKPTISPGDYHSNLIILPGSEENSNNGIGGDFKKEEILESGENKAESLSDNLTKDKKPAGNLIDLDELLKSSQLKVFPHKIINKDYILTPKSEELDKIQYPSKLRNKIENHIDIFKKSQQKLKVIVTKPSVYHKVGDIKKFIKEKFNLNPDIKQIDERKKSIETNYKETQGCLQEKSFILKEDSDYIKIFDLGYINYVINQIEYNDNPNFLNTLICKIDTNECEVIDPCFHLSGWKIKKSVALNLKSKAGLFTTVCNFYHNSGCESDKTSANYPDCKLVKKLYSKLFDIEIPFLDKNNSEGKTAQEVKIFNENLFGYYYSHTEDSGILNLIKYHEDVLEKLQTDQNRYLLFIGRLPPCIFCQVKLNNFCKLMGIKAKYTTVSKSNYGMYIINGLVWKNFIFTINSLILLI